MSKETGPTKTMQILRAYLSGEPMTYRDVIAITGTCEVLTKNIGRRLQRRGYVEVVGRLPGGVIQIRITEAGAQHAQRAGYMGRACPQIDPVVDTLTTVERAIASMPLLAKCWAPSMEGACA